MDDTLATFVAITAADVSTAQQYLESCDFNLESAVELYFASDGAPVATAGGPAAGGEDQVRDRIEGFDDQLVDEEAQYYNAIMRESRRAEARARKPRGIFNQDRDLNLEDSNLSRHERRLAQLFRPPFDIIQDLTFEEAKEEAQKEGKIVLVNVQDMGEFVCQQLNRDLWRSSAVKEVVEKHCVFVQYDAEDPDGEDYRVLYPFQKFPYIAVVDAFTGGQQKVWDEVPRASTFIEELLDEVAKLKDEFNEVANTSDNNNGSAGTDAEMHADPPASAPAPAAAEPEPEPVAASAPTDPIEQITPLDIEEPAQGVRIQLRFSDGSRLVRRFNLSDTVSTIYAVVKHIKQVPKPSLTCDRRELKTELDLTIEQAKLANSTILVE